MIIWNNFFLLEKSINLDIPLSIHVSQSVVEFNEMLKRHGKTPIAWLRDIGFLQENVISLSVGRVGPIILPETLTSWWRRSS
jgi:hypothetical protein